jgi:nucleotide-binding universal stress UspA family protein
VPGSTPDRVPSAVATEAHSSELRVFERIICGVDGTPASLVAVRQALRLQAENGSVFLLAVTNLARAAHAGMAASHAAGLLEDEAEAALAEARAIAPSAGSELVHGAPVTVLLKRAESERATLIAVGSHGRGRAAGLLLGTVAARMLRDATCSVLVARAADDVEAWPQTVVVGVDGSLESAAAFAAARSVATRFGGSSLRVLASTKDQLDGKAARAIAPELEEHGEPAVKLLVAAAEPTDIIVVGSRGLHGLKALGSVSERVAHQARSSVLVVRPAQT